MDLPRTCAYVEKQLDEMGIPWKECGGELPGKMTQDFVEAGFPKMERAVGVTAVIGKGSPCILLRADMDALPIQEENDLEFKSCNGLGHMCGHDSHTAMLLGAARILKEMEEELPGTVKLMFQPGEETGAGARMMVEYGALENPKVDAAFGMHVQSVDETGKVGYSTGVNSASLDTFILKIKGKGGHSSQPQLCVDPLMIMNQVYQAVNLLVTRETDPAAMVALTCGVAKGGTAVNIIPEEAQLHIGVRTLNMEAAEHLKKRIPEVIDHYVKAWRGSMRSLSSTLRVHTVTGIYVRNWCRRSHRLWEKNRFMRFHRCPGRRILGTSHSRCRGCLRLSEWENQEMPLCTMRT